MSRREKHPLIPHLWRELGPLTAGEAIYPYLKQQSASAPTKPAPRLSDAARHEVSPLGGVAVPSKGGR